MYKKILVPLDGSDMAECVIPQVKSMAENSNETEVMLLHVWEPPQNISAYPSAIRYKWELPHEAPSDGPATDAMKWKEDWKENPQINDLHAAAYYSQERYTAYLEKIQKIFTEAGIKSSVNVTAGTPAVQIVDFAVQNKVDVIVMSASGRSGIVRWALGSVVDKVLHTSPVPVISVKPKECK